MHQKNKKKLLFISHDASRTGGPIALLHFLTWLKNEQQYDITVFLQKRGDLERDFEQVAATWLPKETSAAKRIFKKIITKAGIKVSNTVSLPPALLKQRFDIVYLNTVAALNFAPVTKKAFNCPVICHVHENDFTIKKHFANEVTTANLQSVDKFIAISKSTRDNLIKSYGLKPGDISLVYPYINITQTKQPTIAAADIKQQLGLTNEFVIGGSGLTTWRKGVDLFVQLAVQLKQLKPQARFKLVWVGMVIPEFGFEYNYEADRLGIADKVIFTGVKPDPKNYFQVFDAFVLSSREEPFGLVAMEAASLKKPVLCFDAAGGFSEVISNGESGIIVPYGDVKAMAQSIVQLMDNPDSRLKIGEQGERLMANYDVAIAGQQIVQVIAATLAS